VRSRSPPLKVEGKGEEALLGMDEEASWELGKKERTARGCMFFKNFIWR
jgi:hypothetical protein